MHASIVKGLAAALLIAGFAGTALAQDTIWVGPTRGITTIQGGIDAADDGDTVRIDDAVYTGAGNWDLNFNGKAITVKSDAGIPDNCIIDINLTSGHRGFLFNSGEGSDSILGAITIREGKVTGTADGAGIKFVGSSPSLVGVVIEYCESGGKGAGVYCDDGSDPEFSNCWIRYNEAGTNGGGVSCDNSSNPSFIACEIALNDAVGDGGGIHVKASSAPTFLSCLIRSNSTSSNGADGGGAYVKGSASTALFDHCVFRLNVAWAGGGAVTAYEATVTLQNCVLESNLGGTDGGAGKAVQGGDIIVLSCTLTSNRAVDDGGAFYINGGSGTTLTVRNSILWDNVEDYPTNSNNQIHTASTPTVTVTYSCLETTTVYTGTGNINDDPDLAYDATYNLTFRIDSSSPCYDAGDDAYVSWALDLEGDDRVQDSETDMGADEVD